MTHAPSRSPERIRAGLVMAIGSAVAFGANIVGAQLSSAAGLSGPLMVFYRTLLMVLGLALVVAIFRAPLRVAAKDRGPLIVLGLTSALVGTAYLSSVAFLPVSVAAVIFYTFPIIIVLAEPFVSGMRFGPERILLALAAFTGIALVIGPDFASLDPRGIALAAAASLMASVQFFAATRSAAIPDLSKLFWVNLMIGPVVVLILAVTGGFRPPQALLAAPGAVAVTVLGFVVGFALQFAALSRIEAGPAALAFCLEPVSATVFAALVLGERILPLQYLGGLLVLGAVAANVMLEQRRARRA